MKIDVPLKRPEFKRDEMGRFDRRGGDLIKKRGVIKRNTEGQKGMHGGPRAGAGRPPGSKNKITLALKEAILAAAENAGGEEGMVGYLQRLAIENSSAFASLLGKVLPTTLASDSSGGDAMTPAEVEKLIAAAKLGRHGQRDATLILVAFRHGLRAVEIADLEWSQVEWGRNPALHVRRAKNGKPAVHPIRGDELRNGVKPDAIQGRVALNGRKQTRSKADHIPTAP